MLGIAYYVAMFVVGRIYKEISFKPIAIVFLGALFITGIANYMEADFAAGSGQSPILLFLVSFMLNLVVASVLFALGFWLGRWRDSRDEI